MADIERVEFGDIGEPVIGDTGPHPWIRCIGDQIVRYVRPSIEDPTIQTLRAAGAVGETILPTVLGRVKDKLEMELDILREYGVNIVESTVEVCPIPVFNRSGEITGKHLGLRIDSEIINGDGIVSFRPETEEERVAAVEEVQSTFDALQKYIVARTDAGEPYLRDIYSEFQYLYGAPLGSEEKKLFLVDLDPMFSKPSILNFMNTGSHINSVQQLLLHHLRA